MIINDFDFDFDEWMELGKTDSEAFEARREESIRCLIEQFPQKSRELSGLQFRLNMIRRKSTNPLGSCMKFYSILMDHILSDLDHDLELISTSKATDVMDNSQKPASVITPFRKG